MTRWIGFWLAASLALFPLQEISLFSGEISAVMEEILDQHAGRKEIDEEVLQGSFSNYLDQFDPQKTYLLQEEAAPYLDLEPEQLKKYAELYSKKNYAPYREMHELIQRAIGRSRAIYQELKSEESSLFSEGALPRAYPSFAENREELKRRIREEVRGFILHSMERWGALAVLQKKERILNLYEREKREREAPYLFFNARGDPLPSKEASEQFSLFVLKALAKTLDPHTAVFDEEEAKSMKMRLQKGYEGAGIAIEEELEGIFISALLPKSPAERSGKIAVGDQILAIEGVSLKEASLRSASELLEGAEGEPVTLILKKRGSAQPASVTLVRELIILEDDRAAFSYERFQNGILGTIVLNSFYQNKRGVSSEKDVKHAIEKLKQSGPLRGLVLDLRDNSGGYLSEAVKVAGLFITNGVIVVSKYHDGSRAYYRDFDGKTFYEGPLVILTSTMTASAAEIVAQALQDWGVAIVVGDSRTFGKGSIQNQTVTEGSESGSFFKVTVGKYYTVSGKSPEFGGVKADIVVPGPYGEEFLPKQQHELFQNRIEPAFKDSLTDVEPKAKGWFLRYYLPALQVQKTRWREMIPRLRQESLKRLQEASLESGEDLQMREALLVLKDMIQLDRAALGQGAGAAP